MALYGTRRPTWTSLASSVPAGATTLELTSSLELAGGPAWGGPATEPGGPGCPPGATKRLLSASGSSRVLPCVPAPRRIAPALRGGEKRLPVASLSAANLRRFPSSTYSRVLSYTNGSTTRAHTSWNAESAAVALANTHAAPNNDEARANDHAKNTQDTVMTTMCATSLHTSTTLGRMFTCTYRSAS